MAAEALFNKVPASPESGAVASVEMLQQQQSLMMQAAASRRQEESLEMDRQKFEILRPVMESEARLQLVSEGVELAAAKQANDFAMSAIAEFPAVMDDWFKSARIPDPKERKVVRSEILGRATGFSGVKKLEPYLKSFKEEFMRDTVDDRTIDLANNRLEVAGMKQQTEAAEIKFRQENEAAKREIDRLKAENAQIKVDLRTRDLDRREKELAHAKEIATMRDETTRRGQDMTTEVRKAQIEGANKRPANAAARKLNDAVLTSAQDAAVNLQKVDQALTLFDDPDLRTGTGAAFIAAAKKIGGIFGADTGNVKNLEQLQSVFGDVLLGRAKLMRGSLSDKDVKILDGMAPSVAKTPEGNKILLSLVKSGYQNQLRAAAIIQEGRTPGAEIPEAEVQWNVNNYFQNLPPLPAANADLDAKRKRLEEINRKLATP